MQTWKATFVEWEGAAVASLLCALPAAIFSDRPLAAMASFAVLSMLHMIVVGIPVYSLLQWRKAASARNCVIAGTAGGALSSMLMIGSRLAPTGSGALATALSFAVSGAAVAYVFWRYVAWRREGEFIDALAARLPRQSTDDQLFRTFRQGAGGHPFMQKALDKARVAFEARRVADVSVRVEADSTGRNRYALSITNKGSRVLTGLRLHYEPLLLDAESFGLDTTHMPADQARLAGEALRIAVLAPGRTERFVLAGWGDQDAYDGPRDTAMNIEYRAEDEVATAADRRWCPVSVQLPGARRA